VPEACDGISVGARSEPAAEVAVADSLTVWAFMVDLALGWAIGAGSRTAL